MKEIPEPGIDFRSPEIQKNPYSTYEHLLANFPVFRIGRGQIGICLHEDAVFALSNQKLFGVGSPAVVSPEWQTHKRGMFILTQDDPDHAINKSLINKAFVHRVISQLEPYMRELISQLIETKKGKQIEFFREFGWPYTSKVLGKILGTLETQAEHMGLIYRWIELLERDNLEKPSETHIQAVNVAYRELDNWYDTLTESRRNTPRDDVISSLVHAHKDGLPLTKDEIYGAIDLFLIAGFQSTAQLLASALIFLSSREDIQSNLRANPELIPSFIEEMLRYGGISHAVLRVTKADIEHRGFLIPKDTLVSIYMAAANRDPRVFDKPNEFIMNRANIRRQIGFGAGIHACIGAALARLEVRVALELIISITTKISCPEYEAIDWLSTPTTRGARSLPITFN